MSKFVFIEKEDELYWWITADWHKVHVPMVLPNQKYNMRMWIEYNCNKNVIVFGRTRWPSATQLNWDKIIAGDGSIDVFFEDINDAAHFKLAWG